MINRKEKKKRVKTISIQEKCLIEREKNGLFKGKYTKNDSFLEVKHSQKKN